MSKPAKSTLLTDADIISWHCLPEESNNVQLLENDINSNNESGTSSLR
jgi:hypothetical protein